MSNNEGKNNIWLKLQKVDRNFLCSLSVLIFVILSIILIEFKNFKCITKFLFILIGLISLYDIYISMKYYGKNYINRNIIFIRPVVSDVIIFIVSVYLIFFKPYKVYILLILLGLSSIIFLLRSYLILGLPLYVIAITFMLTLVFGLINEATWQVIALLLVCIN